MKVNLSGAFLALAFLAQIHPAQSFGQSDPRNIFTASAAIKGKTIVEYDAGGVQIATVNIKDTTAQQFLSCNWGPDLLALASLSLDPDVSLALNNSVGKVIKRIPLGPVGSVVSLVAIDMDANGLCDLLTFDKNGNGTLYPDVATNGTARSFVKLPARYNYALLLKNHAISGFISFGKGQSAVIKNAKKAKAQVKNPPISLTMSSMSGDTLSTLKLARGVKSVIPLDYSSEAGFALIKDGAIVIIDESGAVKNTIKIKKGSEVFAKDAQRLGYVQLIIPGESSFTIYDPALNTSTESVLGAEPAQPAPSPTPADGSVSDGTGGGTGNFDPNNPGSGLEACGEMSVYVQDLLNQGRGAEAQALLPKLMQICTDALNRGPINDPGSSYGLPYLPPGQGLVYVKSVLHPKDGASDAVGPCSVMLNPIDGFKQGMTIKNSDAHHGTIAWLFPGGKEALNARLIDPKKFKIVQRLEDHGYNFPDNHGVRHLYRSNGSVRGIGGKIAVAETNGLIECWVMPRGRDRID
jgi:hypothetical protein